MRAIFTVVVMLFHAVVNAQVLPVIDSLTRQLHGTREPLQRTAIYNELVGQWAEANFDSAYKYSTHMLRDALVINDSKLVVKAMLALGVTHDYHNHIDSARYYYGKAKSISKQQNDIENEARADFNLATLEYAAGNYVSAIQVYRSTEQLFRKLNNERALSRIYNNLGQVFLRSEQYRSAIEAFKQSIELKEKLNDVKGKLNTLTNLSVAYQKTGEHTTAIKVSNETLRIAHELGDSLAYKNELISLGRIYRDKNRLDSAFYYWKESEKLMQESDSAPILGWLWVNLADAYTTRKMFPDAWKYLSKAERVQETDPVLKLEFLQTTVKYYAGIHQFQKAFEYQQQVIEETRRQTGEGVMKKLKEYETLYETEKKERQISELETGKREAELESQQRTRQLVFFIIIALIALLATTIIFYQYRQKQEANRQLSKSLGDREVLLREIHHRVKNNLQIISSLLNLQVKNLNNPAVIDAVTEGRNRVKSMSMIHEQLYQKENLAGIRMQEYIQQLCDALFVSYKINDEKMKCVLETEDLLLDIDTAIPIGLILNELISNTCKYAFPDGKSGEVRIVLKREQNSLRLAVSDTGTETAAVVPTGGFGFNLIAILAEKLQATVIRDTHKGFFTELNIQKFHVL